MNVLKIISTKKLKKKEREKETQHSKYSKSWKW